jgi:DNA-binding transcriptional LysR family regulator
MKNINLEWLRTFDTFAGSPNITEAAKSLGISQPAVTLHLKNMESLFDLPIFQNVGRRKQLTPFGRELQQITHESLTQLERKIDHLNLLHADPHQVSLRLGGRREILEKILTRVSSDLHIKAISFNSDEAVTRLKNLDLDIAFTHTRPDSLDLVAKSVFKETARLIVHPKLVGKGIDPTSNKHFLTTTPVLFYKETTPYLYELFAHHNLDASSLRPRLIIDNWNVIISMVEKGKGYALVPSSFELGEKTISYPLPKKLDQEIEVFAVYHTSSKKSKALMELLKNLSSF